MEETQQETNNTPNNKLLSNKEIITDWKMLLPWVLVVLNAIFLSMIIVSIIDRISPLCSYDIGRNGNLIHTTCPSILWGYEMFAMFSSLFLTNFGLVVVIPIILVSSIVPGVIVLPPLIKEAKNSFAFMNMYKERSYVKFLRISILFLPILLAFTILFVNMQILRSS